MSFLFWDSYKRNIWPKKMNLCFAFVGFGKSFWSSTHVCGMVGFEGRIEELLVKIAQSM